MNNHLRIAAALSLTLLVHKPAAAQYVAVDNDQIGRKAYTLAVVGNITWSYNRADSNQRGVSWNFSAFQADRTYRALCIGVQMMRGTTRVGSTAGAVGGTLSWSITGPSYGATGTYTRTTDRAVDGEGFMWNCPGSPEAYQRVTAVGSQTAHSMVEGKLEHLAVRACLALNTRDPYNRWCTPWDVNSYGGQ